jgi:hypothetical protein
LSEPARCRHRLAGDTISDQKRRMDQAALAEIPLIDARDGGTAQHARQSRERALALQRAVTAWFPRLIAGATPLLDRGAKRLLARAGSPYLDEVDAIAAILGVPGIWFLNGSYLWSCTSLARVEEVPWLARTLDWPFPGLGRYSDVVRMRGPAGEYFNVSWAGYVGVLTACAPGRFAAAINQAPMRRRTQARALRLFDFAANAIGTISGIRHQPPDQLLRQVFDTCADYAQAKQMLESTPIARPVIYTVAGCRPGECCVIERTEETARTREGDTGAANDWIEPHPHWEARIGVRRLFSSTFQDAANYSRVRRTSLAGWPGAFAKTSFGWVEPPVLNPYTRLAVEMCPARGIVRAVGFEREGDAELASPVTMPCEIAAERIAA